MVSLLSVIVLAATFAVVAPCKEYKRSVTYVRELFVLFKLFLLGLVGLSVAV